MLLKYLKTIPNLSGCILGFRGLFKDPDALLVDLEDPNALTPHLPLIENCVLASKGLAIMRTSYNRKDWIETLTKHDLGGLSARVRRIRRRGGKEWAKPATLGKQGAVDAARETGTMASQSVVHFMNAPVSLPLHVIVHVMLRVSTLLAIPLTQVPPEQQIPKDETCYQIQQNITGQWNRKVFVWLRSTEEHQSLHKRVHGSSFAVFDETITIEVSNRCIQFDSVMCENFVLPLATVPSTAMETSSGLVASGISAAQGSLRSGGQ